MLNNASKVGLVTSRGLLLLTLGLMFNLTVVIAEEQVTNSAPVKPAAVYWMDKLKKIGVSARGYAIEKAQEMGEKVIKLADTLEVKGKSEENGSNGAPASAVSTVPDDSTQGVFKPEATNSSTVSSIQHKTETSLMPAQQEKELVAETLTVSATLDNKSAETSKNPVAPVVAQDKKIETVESKDLDLVQPDSWNTNYVIGGVAAATVVVGAIGYWYVNASWARAVKKLVAQAQFNPNVIINDLSVLLESWNGFDQQQQIIEYVEAHVAMTPELVALLDLYKR